MDHQDEKETSHARIIEAAYNSIAPVYQSLFSARPSATRLKHVQALADSLHPGAHVLEVGCGGGLGTLPFVARGCQITGIDISAEQIALARTSLPNATLIHSDMNSLDFASGTFDAVVALYCLMHLTKEEQREMIPRIVRWLKPDGYLLCSLPGGEAETRIGKWLGAKMFWESLGVEGNRELLTSHKLLRIVEDEVIVDKLDHETSEAVEEPEETFHWILTTKVATDED